MEKQEHPNRVGNSAEVYLYLFHGREAPKQDTDGWGEPGPVLGPLTYVHTTYGHDIKTEYTDHLGEHRCVSLRVEDGVVYYDGMYYGDWTITAKENLEGKAGDAVLPRQDLAAPKVDDDKPLREAMRNYLKTGGVRCPFCVAADISGAFGETGAGNAAQEISCAACGKNWTDNYTLTAVTHNGTDYGPRV